MTTLHESAAEVAVTTTSGVNLWRRLKGSRSGVVWSMLALSFLVFSLADGRFLTTGNMSIMLTSAAITFLVAIGLTFVLLSGGFDLGLGSVLALTGIALGSFATSLGLPIGLAILLALCVAALIGAANGVLIGRMDLSFLVVTLGTSSLALGVVHIWSHGQTTSVSSDLLEYMAFGTFLWIPVPVVLMAAIYVAALYVLRWTYFGRNVYAVGGNPAAAWLAGVNVATVLAAVYVIAAVLAGIAGILQVARVGAASPLVGSAVLFQAAAAVLLGGTRLGGGVGGVGGTVAGVLFLAVLQNGLSVLGVESGWQQIVTGLILIIALIVDRAQTHGWTARRRRRTPDGGAPPLPSSS